MTDHNCWRPGVINDVMVSDVAVQIRFNDILRSFCPCCVKIRKGGLKGVLHGQYTACEKDLWVFFNRYYIHSQDYRRGVKTMVHRNELNHNVFRREPGESFGPVVFKVGPQGDDGENR